MIGSKVTLAVMLVVAIAAPVRAQPSPHSAAATAQFDTGRRLMARKQYRAACLAFERSHAIDPQAGTLFNLATCYSHIGKLASAWASFRELAQRDPNDRRRREAAKRAARLEPKLPRLALSAPSAPTGLAVTLDGADVTALVGTDTPVDLGAHEIRATAPGARVLTKTIQAEEGMVARVTLALERDEPLTPARAIEATAVQSRRTEDEVRTRTPPAPSSFDGSAEQAPSHSRRRTIGLLVVIGGGALVGTGVVFGRIAQVQWNEAIHACGVDHHCDTVASKAIGDQLVTDARSRARLATGFVIGGAATVALGIVLARTGSQKPVREHRLEIVPEADTSGFSLAVAGRF